MHKCAKNEDWVNRCQMANAILLPVTFDLLSRSWMINEIKDITEMHKCAKNEEDQVNSCC